jgi:hypothetical protein
METTSASATVDQQNEQRQKAKEPLFMTGKKGLSHNAN